MTKDPYWLNTIMEFELVVEVKEGGVIVPRLDLHAPSLLDDQLDSNGWELLNGYSGQYSYRGPVMHPSEFIGGRMADDIASTPGIYVAITADYSPDEEAGETTSEGWAVARRKEG